MLKSGDLLKDWTLFNSTIEDGKITIGLFGSAKQSVELRKNYNKFKLKLKYLQGTENEYRDENGLIVSRRRELEDIEGIQGTIKLEYENKTTEIKIPLTDFGDGAGNWGG